MPDNILIPNPQKVASIAQAFKHGGAAKMHVLADFDRTLTKAFVNGKKIASVLAILREENYLTPDYPDKAHALFEKYHAIEMDMSVPFEEKKKAMHEWWGKHFALLLQSGLHLRDLERVAKSEYVVLRPGAIEFFQELNRLNIPMVILSASGMGGENISMILKNASLLYSNIHIVSNNFIWDANGNAIGVQEPIIHSLNKDETVLQNFPFFEKIKDRKNVLLLGDSPEDIRMVHGFEYENLLKVGFCNETQIIPDQYKQNYDVLILNDGGMEWINEFLYSSLLSLS